MPVGGQGLGSPALLSELATAPGPEEMDTVPACLQQRGLCMGPVLALPPHDLPPAPGSTLVTPARLPAAPTSPERDLPDPLDQKVVTWETVQKENFLSNVEKRRRDSEGEVLRKTAHRCARRCPGTERALPWGQVDPEKAWPC